MLTDYFFFLHTNRPITKLLSVKKYQIPFNASFCTIGEELSRNFSSTDRLPKELLKEREKPSISLNLVTETEIFNIVNY